MNISVLIPALQAERYFAQMLPALKNQTRPPREIIVVDSSSDDNTAAVARRHGASVTTIPRDEFNHGGTRNLAASLASHEILVFMTQDALPADRDFLAKLVAPLELDAAAASYARQLPYPHAPPTEVFARRFNYPALGHSRQRQDIARMGIRAFFFSNVASAVSREVFAEVGGFPSEVISNEDMFLCAKLLRAGHTVRYVSEARVFHSHSYGLAEQFKRYFDIGAALRMSQTLLEGGRAGGEGTRYVWELAQFLAKEGLWRNVPFGAAEIAAKFCAFKLGQQEHLIPNIVKRRISLHAFYWKKPRERRASEATKA